MLLQFFHIYLRSRDINICLICKLINCDVKLCTDYWKIMYIFGITKQNLLKLRQLNASQRTKIKQNQLSFNNPEDIHDIPIIYNNLCITLRHNLSHLHIKQT